MQLQKPQNPEKGVGSSTDSLQGYLKGVTIIDCLLIYQRGFQVSCNKLPDFFFSEPQKTQTPKKEDLDRTMQVKMPQLTSHSTEFIELEVL